MKEFSTSQIGEHLKWVYRQPGYYEKKKRTPQDIINRREANQRYYKLEENKQQKRDYMKEYSKRPYVREKYLAKLKRRINEGTNLSNAGK